MGPRALHHVPYEVQAFIHGGQDGRMYVRISHSTVVLCIKGLLWFLYFPHTLGKFSSYFQFQVNSTSDDYTVQNKTVYEIFH